MSTVYKCQKDKQKIAKTVFLCNKHKLAFHPNCIKYHKVVNSRGERVDCEEEYEIIELKSQAMMNEKLTDDETHEELTNEIEMTTPDDSNHVDSNARKRKRTKEDEDEEKLRLLIQNCMRREVRPLINKIDELQKEIVESKSEIVSLKQTINNLTKQNSLLPEGNEKVAILNNNNNNASTSFANAVRRKKSDAVLVVKPVIDDVTLQGDANKKVDKNANLKNVKSIVNVKELGVGVKSIKEKNNGTVVVKFKNVNDKENLQKNVAKKVGEKFKVQAPKAQKKFLKIVFIDKEEATLTNEELIDDIIKQNNLNDTCEKVEMKIVKRIVHDKKDDFGVIVEVNPELHKILLFLEKISIGWKQCKVINYINLTRCFKCCGFNHHAKDCKRETTCSKCGGAHDSKSCESTNLKCTNCAHKNRNKSNDEMINDKHNAFDKKCPIFIQIAERQKKRAEENI